MAGFVFSYDEMTKNLFGGVYANINQSLLK